MGVRPGMPTSLIEEVSEVQSFLRQLCARDQAVDIQYAGRSGELRTARARLLAVDEGGLSVDQPQNVAEGVELSSGQSIRVLFNHHDSPWAFDSRVLRRNCTVRLNANLRISGMMIQIPATLRMEQRRREFRVPLASANLMCLVGLESVRFPQACDRELGPHRVIVHNASPCGLGIVVDASLRRHMPIGRRLFIELHLPGEEAGFLLVGAVRHVAEVGGRGNLMVGLRVEVLLDEDFARFQQGMSRFLVEEQRKKLRRRR